MLRKEDNDWVKECMDYEVEGARPRGRPRGRPQETWREIVEQVSLTRKLNKEDPMDRKRWRKQLRDD